MYLKQAVAYVKTKAASNLAVICRIRFNVKTRHRIHPDTLCATKWLETKPLLCKVYSDELSRLRFSQRMCVCAYVYVWLRETTDVSGFAMTSFFMMAVCADWSCVHLSRQIAHVLAEENPSSPKTKKYEQIHERCPFHFCFSS